MDRNSKRSPARKAREGREVEENEEEEEGQRQTKAQPNGKEVEKQPDTHSDLSTGTWDLQGESVSMCVRICAGGAGLGR